LNWNFPEKLEEIEFNITLYETFENYDLSDSEEKAEFKIPFKNCASLKKLSIGHEGFADYWIPNVDSMDF
jgi:hypothetical protein